MVLVFPNSMDLMHFGVQHDNTIFPSGKPQKVNKKGG